MCGFFDVLEGDVDDIVLVVLLKGGNIVVVGVFVIFGFLGVR